MNVRVTPYDEIWPVLFQKEAEKIKAIFGEHICDIHHFGSTSVPGMKAKPIIDIMPLVKNIDKVKYFNTDMIALGYEPCGEFGMKGRRYFRKGGDDRTHQVHMFQWDDAEQIDRHLAVRDYLRAHRKDAIAYGDLKEQLALQFPTNLQGYVEGKDRFVKALERRALQWKKSGLME